MLSFLQQGYFMYVAVVLCAAGMICKGISSTRYKRLIRQGKTLGNAKDKQLKQLKGRFENTYRINGSIPNIHAFVERNLREYQVGKITLKRLDELGWKLAGTILLLAGAAGYYAYWQGAGTELVSSLLGTGIAGAIVLLMWCAFCNSRDKQAELETVLCDYLENSLVCRLKSPNVWVENQSPMATDSRAAKRSDVAFLKRSLGKTSSREEDERVLSSDEESLIQEIIQEYLA